MQAQDRALHYSASRGKNVHHLLNSDLVYSVQCRIFKISSRERIKSTGMKSCYYLDSIGY